MTDELEHPWFPEVLDLLDLRRNDRVLLITAQCPTHVTAVLQRVGSHGNVLVVEPSEKTAHDLAESNPGVEVISTTPTGEESFGSFDAFLACPFSLPEWPLELWAALTQKNLRPGGRFAIDLPGEKHCEDLSESWIEIGGGEHDLLPLRGPTEKALADVLRQEGLRMVAAAMGTHIVRLGSPHALAALGAQLMGAKQDRQEELGVALTRRLRTTDAVDVVFHRTRVHGIR